jgi:valyl-tRNA synthetase
MGGDDSEGEVTEPVDLSMLAALAGVVREAGAAFDAYEHTRALEAIERFFWSFCDDYLELVKARAYESGPAAASAHAALRQALDVLLRLFAPFLPFVTEEVWSWWREGSVHQARWPSAEPGTGDPAVLEVAAEVLRQIRRAKSEAKVSMRAEVSCLTVTSPQAGLVRLAQDDLCAAGNVEEFVLEQGEPATIQVSLT